jgi:ectoine hydroxylase-related dioxygenase (phytanoyl-CoA dioxygenase family)
LVVHDLKWLCESAPLPRPQVTYLSVIVALEDIGPGDGPTVFVPASHKSLAGHPHQQQMRTEGGALLGAEECHLRAGDAVIFQDACVHGAAARVHTGWRKTICFRYIPQVGSYPIVTLSKMLTLHQVSFHNQSLFR